MFWLHTNNKNIQMKGKSILQHGSWLYILGTLMLLLFLLPTASYVSGNESIEAYDDGFSADDYGDVDNVEWHHVKIVDGVIQPEDHPIIFYKEDNVNEDFDPAKEKRKNDTTKIVGHRMRKYKEISRRHRTDAEKYRAIKPEKIYFDILSQTPVATAADDSNANDSGFDASKIEIISLADDINVNNNNSNEKETEAETETETEVESKQLLNKRPPKKYRKRQRRDTASSTDEHKVRKRNPYYINSNGNTNLIQYLQTVLAATSQQQQQLGNRKHPIRGNYWNALSQIPIDIQEETMSVGPRGGFDPDRVIWSVVPNRPARVLPPQFNDFNLNSLDNARTTRRPNQARPTVAVPPLIRDPNPANADASFLTTRRPQNQARPTVAVPPLIRDPNPSNADASFLTTRRPQFDSRPTVAVPPLIRDPNPANADTSFLTRRPPIQVAQQTTTRPTFTRSTTIRTTLRPTQSNVPRQKQKVSNCVWAIAQCCSRDNLNIRYQCFEALGCYGAFWDLNPCAERILDNVFEYVDQYLN